MPESAWFLQEQRGTIYWLSIAAVYKAGSDPSHQWGWTNHAYTFQDNAVTGKYVPDATEWEWKELFDQTGESEDLSFVLFTEHCPCLGDMNGDGWMSPSDISFMVSILLPYQSSYYWKQVPGHSCGDMNGDGWMSPADISALVSMLLPYQSVYYWVACP